MAEAAPPADDPNVNCSVTIGKSGNPKVHQLIADLLSMTPQDAAKLCQKPIVTIAQNISSAQAREIKQQLAALNVVAKIATRRAV